MFGEVFGVFPQRIPGALELAGPFMGRARRGVLAGAAAAPCGLATGQRPRVVPGPAPLGIERLGGPGHHMKRIRTPDRGRLRWRTTSAIQSAASRETWVICAHRSAPNASKNRPKVAVSRPGAAHTSRPLS